jgi:peroxiredoxin
MYAEKFRLPFPYLCDPDYEVRRRWGVESRKHGLGHYVATFVKGLRMPKPPNDFGDFAPPIDEVPRLLSDDDMGFFIIDKQGIVRYATTGVYTGDDSGVPLPGNDEVLRELEKLSA